MAKVEAAKVTTTSSEPASAVRGLVNQYEITVLYHPDLEVDLDKAKAKVEKIIKDAGAIINKTDNQGKRKLAYSIKKQEHAIYVFYTVEMPAKNVRKVEAVLNITDEAIRYLIVRPDLKAMAKAEKERDEKAAKAAARGKTEERDEKEEE